MISQLPDSLNLGLAVPAAAIAIEAGLLIHDFYERGVRTEYKGDVDLVTEADRASEKLIVEKLHHETVRLLALPETRKRFDDIGVEPVGSSPAEFAAVIAADLPKWAKVIRGAGIRLD